MTRRTVFACGWLLWVACLLLVLYPNFISANEKEELWQRCHVFVAPSEVGFGVFAGRNFVKGEMIELFAGLLPLEGYSVEVQDTILMDYVHPFWRRSDELSDEELQIAPTADEFVDDYQVLLLGEGGSMYNHHSKANAQLLQMTMEPFRVRYGVFALENIRAGDQIYIDYGLAEGDGGADWFSTHSMDQLVGHRRTNYRKHIDEVRAMYCSKIQAGMGREKWFKDRIPWHYNMPTLSLERFAPFDAGMGDARAKTDIRKGERIEASAGLLVSHEFMNGTPVRPLLYTWEILHEQHRRALVSLRMYYHVKIVGRQSFNGTSTDYWVDMLTSFEDFGILPMGNLALVRRSDAQGTNSNCELRIDPDTLLGVSSIQLELFATEDIKTGEPLILNLAWTGRDHERHMLLDELDLLQQPYWDDLYEYLYEYYDGESQEEDDYHYYYEDDDDDDDDDDIDCIKVVSVAEGGRTICQTI